MTEAGRAGGIAAADRPRRYRALTREQRLMLLTRDQAALRASTLASLVVLVVSFLAWMPAAVAITERLGGLGPSWRDLAAVVVVVGPPLALGLGALWAGRRWCVLRQVGRAACPGCGYGLGGLRVVEGAVRCPECGRSVRLDLYDLRAEDLALDGRPMAGTGERAGGTPRGGGT